MCQLHQACTIAQVDIVGALTFRTVYSYPIGRLVVSSTGAAVRARVCVYVLVLFVFVPDGKKRVFHRQAKNDGGQRPTLPLRSPRLFPNVLIVLFRACAAKNRPARPAQLSAPGTHAHGLHRPDPGQQRKRRAFHKVRRIVNVSRYISSPSVLGAPQVRVQSMCLMGVRDSSGVILYMTYLRPLGKNFHSFNAESVAETGEAVCNVRNFVQKLFDLFARQSCSTRLSRTYVPPSRPSLAGIVILHSHVCYSLFLPTA